MKHVALVCHVMVMTFLLVTFGPVLQVSGWDPALHHALVHEIMQFGLVHAVAPNLGTDMVVYPPAAHWLAAVFGWAFGSGIVAIWLITIASVYFAYYFVGHVLSLGSNIVTIIVFAILLHLMMPTGAMLGSEIVGNFFYPQIVSMAVYFGAIVWLSERQPPSALPVLVVAGLNTVVYLASPLVAAHLTAALMLYLLTDAACFAFCNRVVPWRDAALVLLVAAMAIAIMFLHPKVHAIIRIADRDGALEFLFPGNNAALYILLAAVSAAINLYLGTINWPSAQADRLLGAGCLASVGLIILQAACLRILGIGSEYAVKKHIFIIVTLGAINFARLTSRAFSNIAPQINARWRPICGIGLAAFASFLVFDRPGVDLAKLVRLQNFAEYFASTSAEFAPGNTSTFVMSMDPTENMIVSSSALLEPYSQSTKYWGRLNPESRYLLVDRRNLDAACTITANSEFAVTTPSCLRTFPPNQLVKFGAGDMGARYLDFGWSAPESWGTWGNDHPTLKLSLKKHNYVLKADLMVFLAPKNAKQELKLIVGGREIATWTFSLQQSSGERKAIIPAETIASEGETEISFVPNWSPVSPQEVGIGSDPRKLSIGLKTLLLDDQSTR